MDALLPLFGYLYAILVIADGSLLINNSLTDEPKVQCTPFGIKFDFRTHQPFDGHVYVRGHYSDLQCHRDMLQIRNVSNSFEIPFDRCGLRKQRKMNPKGIVTSATFIITFHRIFVTSVDRAFYVECFYAEEDQMLTQEIGVSALPVADLDTRSQMPMCSYHVLTSTPNGTLDVDFASIGDEVVHKWKCEHEKADMYCMIVHSCSVDDGSDETFEIIDKDGCPKDRYLLDELSYFDDLTAAVKSNVFKFADKPHVHFSCQVRLSLKKEYEDNKCPRPQCDANAAKVRRALRIDRSKKHRSSASVDVDLDSSSILVLDLKEANDGERDVPEEAETTLLISPEKMQREASQLCLSPSIQGLFYASTLGLGLTSLIFLAALVFFVHFRKHCGRFNINEKR